MSIDDTTMVADEVFNFILDSERVKERLSNLISQQIYKVILYMVSGKKVSLLIEFLVRFKSDAFFPETLYISSIHCDKINFIKSISSFRVTSIINAK